MIAHRFAITPRMDFQAKGLGLGEAGLAGAHIHGSLSQSQPDVPPVGANTDWFGFSETRDGASDFVVREGIPGVAGVENGGDIDAFPDLA